MRNVRQPGSLAVEAHQFEQLLLRLGRCRGIRDPLAEGETRLTTPQIHAIYWLGHDGPLTMGELARLGGITEKTITGVVDRLGLAGLTRRERDATDRRVVRVRLTARGEVAFARLRNHAVGRIEAAFSFIDPEDRKALFRIVEKLQQRLADALAETGSKRKGVK